MTAAKSNFTKTFEFYEANPKAHPLTYRHRSNKTYK